MKGKSLNAEIRKERGKNANRRLRSKGFIPAVIISHGESESVSISKNDFRNLFEGTVSESVIFDVNIANSKENEPYMAFVKDYQEDPITGDIVHLDLFRVTSGETIHTHIPIEVIGTAVGVKTGGILEVSERTIEVKCLPKDLPERIVLDISKLDVGDALHAVDIELDESIQLLTNPETVIASVHMLRVVEEPVVEELEEDEERELEEGEEAAAEGEEETKESEE